LILDLYWYGPDIQGHVGNLDWDRETFPTAERMIEDLDDKGIKTILVTQPFVLSSSNRWQDAVDNKVLAKNDDGEPYRFDFYFGNTGLIDVFDENAREWFWDKYVNIFDDGVAGTWGDLGEPEVHPDDIIHYLSETQSTARGEEVHNAFGHQLAGVLSGDIHDFIIKEGKATIEVELAPLESEVIRFRTRW
jgi:oligosaccharide 4-alpha-D-glucosyltransferase